MVEVLVVASIVALAFLPMIDVFRSGSRQLEQTQPYHQAVFLGEKCLEESRLGAEEDPYFLSRLLVDGYGAEPAPVTGGRHPFFAVLEDTAVPWGRIEPSEDGAIQKESGPLHDQVEPFIAAVQSNLTQGSPPQPPEAEARVQFDWIDGRDKAMRYELIAAVRVWVPRTKVEVPVPSGEELELAKAIDAGATQGIGAIAAARGADAEKLRAVAKLLVYGREARSTAERATALAATLRAEVLGAGEGPARDGKALRLGRLDEAMAARTCSLLQQMRPPLEALAQALPPGALGEPAPPKALLAEAVELVRLTLDGFQKSVGSALADYGALARQEFVPSGWRPSLHVAILRLAKMAALTYPWPDRKPLHAYLAELAAYYRGRMPHMVHFCEQEDQLVESLEQTWPLSAAAADARKAREAYAAAAMKLLLYSAPLAPQ